ncbi:31938_t:CDS:2, partial [Gigaspora margarita]
ELIQQLGRAGHNSKQAQDIIFFNCHIISNPCNKCDNCIQYDEDNPILFDATEELYEILEVAKALTFKFSTKISLEDVVN